MFGKDRLRAVLRGARDASAPEIVSAVVEAVDGFREGERQRDDVTMIVLKKE
jgi:serine phosphatase RsbU (regulator of sigma subunit)